MLAEKEKKVNVRENVLGQLSSALFFLFVSELLLLLFTYTIKELIRSFSTAGSGFALKQQCDIWRAS